MKGFFNIPIEVAETNNHPGYMRRVYQIRHDLGPQGTFKEAWAAVETERAFFGFPQMFTYGTFRHKIRTARQSAMERGLKFI